MIVYKCQMPSSNTMPPPRPKGRPRAGSGTGIPIKPPRPATPRRGGSLIFSNAYQQTNQKGGEVPCPNFERGIPTPPTPTPKPERGIPALPTPTLTKDRVPPPSGCTHPATVSAGVMTELPFPHTK